MFISFICFLVFHQFYQDLKNSGTSPLSQYAATLRQRAQERSGALTESRLITYTTFYRVILLNLEAFVSMLRDVIFGQCAHWR